MAWEEFERNGTMGVSGDEPIDEMALALERISTAYENRFSRKPTVTEVLYALETVLTTHRTRYVSDTEGLKLGEIVVKRNDYEYIDVNEYEASAGADPPGYIFVSQRASQKNDQTEVDVIKITKFEVQERTLQIEYEVLTPDISTKMAQTLISKVVLDEFYDGDFYDKADNINFINTKSYSVNVQLQNQ